MIPLMGFISKSFLVPGVFFSGAFSAHSAGVSRLVIGTHKAVVHKRSKEECREGGGKK